MKFNIAKFDNMNYEGDSKDEAKAIEFRDELVEIFLESPEGKKCQEKYSDIDYWVYPFIDFCFNYIGCSPAKVSELDVEEIMIELFPRKLTLSSPSDADKIIPTLIAFWEYLLREFKLSNAKQIISYLHDLKPNFADIMNDPSNFGMAKSFVNMGRKAGVDMNNQEEIDKFIVEYNASLAESPKKKPPLPDGIPFHLSISESEKIARRNKKKKARKSKKLARKKNRRK